MYGIDFKNMCNSQIHIYISCANEYFQFLKTISKQCSHLRGFVMKGMEINNIISNKLLFLSVSLLIRWCV